MLMSEMAEIFRRAVWNLYRIEWEVLVQQERESTNKDRAEYDRFLLLKS